MIKKCSEFLKKICYDQSCLSIYFRPGPGGKPCAGNDVIAELCNIRECTTSQLSFKAAQCAATNSQSYQGTYYSWEPYQGMSGTAYSKNSS